MRIMKRYIICLLLCVPVLSVYTTNAQNEKRAEELLTLLMAGQGDSIYIRLNDEIRSQANPTMLNGLFGSIEQQFGKYESRSEWGETQISGTTVYFCDIQFGKIPLRFHTAFDADGKINSLNFVPVPRPAPTSDVGRINEKKMEEHPIEVVCGEYKLPGLLTQPKGERKVPVVILVHGSGTHDRDETIGAYKPFREIAWGLADRGIATIRYDKRTNVYGRKFAPAGKDTYDEETVDDVLAAIDLAKTIQSVDTRRVYVLGHSLGAMLAPRIAERAEGRLAGIIMLAGPARPLEDALIEQIIYLSSLKGVTLEGEALDQLQKQMNNVKKIGTDAFDESIDLPLTLSLSYWAFSNAYHQVDVAKGLTLPIFIVQGERDYQVTMEDFALWRSALSDKANVAFKSYPALNHLFHEGQGKSTPNEYMSEGKSIPGYVIDDISDWIAVKNSKGKE